MKNTKQENMLSLCLSKTYFRRILRLLVIIVENAKHVKVLIGVYSKFTSKSTNLNFLFWVLKLGLSFQDNLNCKSQSIAHFVIADVFFWRFLAIAVKIAKHEKVYSGVYLQFTIDKKNIYKLPYFSPKNAFSLVLKSNCLVYQRVT